MTALDRKPGLPFGISTTIVAVIMSIFFAVPWAIGFIHIVRRILE
jgi:hypothetical protein